MFDNLRKKIAYALNGEPNSNSPKKTVPISPSITENMVRLREQFPNSSDLNKREMEIGKSKILLLSCEGMINAQTLALSIIKPLSELEGDRVYSGRDICDFIMHKSILSVEQREIFDFDTLFTAMMSGFVIILIEGEQIAFALAAHGFQFRSISEPSNEANELGPKEAFTEPLRINLSMVRRRIKSPKLRFELMSVGAQSKTDLCLIYLSDRASPKLIKEVRKKLKKINLDVILDSSYVRPYLENHPFSLFSSVGNTERPDVLCGKINEGRIAVLVDGSPYALIVPFLFGENFKSFDDYARRPYFSTFVRILKYLSFYISFLLPGAYV
ncbi:MAG: spore germination protein, partial [Oscillospiraceae bacterium]|nr:spore germination protein [Oscillospiraceae bacterium]